MIRIVLADGCDNLVFRRTINLGDIIALLLGADRELADVAAGAADDLTGATRSLDGNTQSGMHGEGKK